MWINLNWINKIQSKFTVFELVVNLSDFDYNFFFVYLDQKKKKKKMVCVEYVVYTHFKSNFVQERAYKNGMWILMTWKKRRESRTQNQFEI